jgi:sulfur-oxidizing protein SoxX
MPSARLLPVLLLLAVPAMAQPARDVRILDDGIPAALTGAPGDPVRGRALVADRTRGLCLLCHSGPFPEQRFQGNLAPDLAGAGARWSAAQLRLRLVDGRRLNPDSIMPSYYRTEGLARVGPAFRGRTILTAEEIEDVLAFLMTLGEGSPR